MERQIAKLRSVAAISAVVGLTLAGCGSTSSTTGAGAPTATKTATSSGGQKPIIIGAAVAESGPFVAYDGPMMTSLKIGINNINRAGGINGRQIKLVTADTQSNPTLGPQAADQVISEGAQVVVVSCDYDHGSAAALTAEAKGLVSLSCAGDPKFGPTGIGPLAFDTGTANAVEAAAAAQWLHQRGYKRGYVLLDNTIDYTKTVYQYFKQAWKPFGTIVGTDTFQNGDPSIATQITRLQAVTPRPDFIYLDTYTPGGASALRQIRAAGINIPIFAAEGLEGTYWLAAVPHLSNFYTVYIAGGIHGDDPRPDINALYKQYVTATGKAPTTSLAYMGYPMAQILQQAITKAGTTDGTALAKVLVADGPWNTILGPTQYTAKYHISFDHSEAISEVENGKARIISIVTPTNVPQP